MSDNKKRLPFGIVVHGGAGTILKSNMTPELEEEYRELLKVSLKAGYDVLESGGTSLDAVQKAVNIMEDSPLFNAGRGAVFTHEGLNEQDACIMDGATLNVGAVAAVKHIARPIDLARLVLDKSPHVLLAGEGAEDFAQANGMKLVAPDYFFTERRWEQLQKALKKEEEQGEVFDRSNLDHSVDDKFGTVGAVALDQAGNLAAATSTGGMTNKRYSRIGDSPIIGAGTYANNATCAISATGYGEYIMRVVASYDVSALMEYKGMSLAEASREVVHTKLEKIGGTGGLVAIDHEGNIAMPFNTEGMYRGYYLPGGEPTVAIYGENDGD